MASPLDEAIDRLERAFVNTLSRRLGRPPGQTNEEADAEYLAARAALVALVKE